MIEINPAPSAGSDLIVGDASRATTVLRGGSFSSLTRASALLAANYAFRGCNSRATSRSVHRVRAALIADSLHVALREMDRAWRYGADDAESLAPLYGRLLALEERDLAAALRMLQSIAVVDSDVLALTAHTLFILQRGVEARRYLESALAGFCVHSDGLLAYVATEIARQESSTAPGWIGLAPSLEFVGELTAKEPVHSLQIHIHGNATFTQPIRASQDGARGFRFRLPQLAREATLMVLSQGVPLLGSGLKVPGDFGVDGRAAARGRCLSGWVRVGWDPTQSVRLLLEDDTGACRRLTTRRVPNAGLRWPFHLNLSAVGVRGTRIRICAELPDGRWQPLPDTPLLLAHAVRLPGSRALPAWRAMALTARRPRPRRKSSIDVIIPVYQGRDETIACIDSVLQTVDRETRIIVVDDATLDPTLAAALDELALHQRITLLRNATNLGFVASANRALEQSSTRDAVLLNADTQVFGDWLTRLHAAAYSAPRVGTVTPFSNSGSIASYPRNDERPLDPTSAAGMHGLASVIHSEVSLEIPVGVGFCIYVRRDCLREVGGFDEAAFGKGYGEETDFCMRARLRGWSHRLAADVFVYHAGGLSFGRRRAALLERSQRLLELRHPGFYQFIASFVRQDPLLPLRRRLDEERLAGVDGRFVLLVSLALPGGVERFVDERAHELRARGLIPLVLRPFQIGDARVCEISTVALDVPNLRYRIPADLDALTTLLRRLPLDAVEIQHFLHLDARVIEMLRALAVPYDVYLHDYSWFCPRVTLIDGSGRYCGEPAVAVCTACVKRNGSQLGEAISVIQLRGRSERWLHAARRVFAPVADTAARFQTHFVGLNVEVRPHAPPASPPAPMARAAPGARVRVALIGAIGKHKGYEVLLNCARDAAARDLPLEFVVIGYTENDAPLLKSGRVFVTGRYSEGEAPHLLHREQVNVTFLPSVWPETWCYTLDDAVGAGVPIVAFDLGAIPERLHALQIGNIIPLDLEPYRINDRLLSIAAESVLSQAKDAVIMGQSEVNSSMKRPAVRESIADDSLMASVQVLPLPPGLYLFSVKEAGAIPSRSEGQLQLPAMHVGLGPGVRSEHVEFVSGLSTEGAWLFAQSDLLVAKVKLAGAALVLTSVRAPGGETLSIKVERLASRAEEVPVAVPALVAPPVRSATAASGSAKGAPKSSPTTATDSQTLSIQISAHIRTRGDLSFIDAPWAGRIAPGLWIESFSIRPLEHFGAAEIEYKALTGSGFETPWLSDAVMCGTKGMAVPLVGFAVRLKSSATSAAYDCEYSGYYKSGVTVGPLRNGAPCRSTVANDPLEGIQVHLTKRAAVRNQVATPTPARARTELPGEGTKGPSFGRYRDENPTAKHNVPTPKSLSKSKNNHKLKKKTKTKSPA